MRKCIIQILFSIISFSSFAQETLLDILPLQNGIVTYSGVAKVDSLDKNALYLKAKKWFVSTYKSAKDVIQFEDKESGEITGKGNFKIAYYTRDPYISHNITITVKDGRYKYTITQFSYSDNQNEKFAIENFPNSWAGKKKLYLKIDEETKYLISSLEKHMKTNIKDDW